MSQIMEPMKVNYWKIYKMILDATQNRLGRIYY